jgi:hypothetical protein
MPGPVKIAREEFLAMNRNRVALAKAKKRLQADPGDPKYKDKVAKLESAYQGKKLEFEAAQRTAEKHGYQVNKLGKWTNQSQGQTKPKVTGPDLESMSQTELQELRDRINGMLGESGAANQALAVSKPGVVHGHVVKAYGTDPNTVYQMRYEVRELDDLITSNDDNGKINPEFPKVLQPRDRSRLASKVQIDNIAKKMNPDAMLEEFKSIDRGTPIIGDDNVVESGNGRSLALRRAKNEYPEQFEEYQAALKQTAAERGIDPSTLDGFKNPVLVRVRQSDVDREQFAKDANTASILATSDTEKAKSDAGKISPTHLQNLTLKDTIDQTLRSSDNKNFVMNFVASVPETERAGMMTKSGELTQSGENRIKAAMFNRVYDDPDLSDRIFETTDNDIKSITNGVMNSLPKMARAEEMVSTGARAKDLSIAGDVGAAVRQFSSLKVNNLSVDNYLNQGKLFGSDLTPTQEKILVEIDKRRKSGKQVTDLLDKWADLVEAEPHPSQGSLFGPAGSSKDELVDRWLKQANEPQPTQGGFF